MKKDKYIGFRVNKDLNEMLDITAEKLFDKDKSKCIRQLLKIGLLNLMHEIDAINKKSK